MTRDDTMARVDRHFAQHLGCDPEALRQPGVTAVPYEIGQSSKDRTPPKPLWIFRRGSSLVLSAEPWALELVKPLFTMRERIEALRDCSLSRIRGLIEEHVDVWFWFLGHQLYCDEGSFTPHFHPRCRTAGPNDPAVRDLAERHYLAFSGVSIENGDVFGLFVGHELASYSWIKPRSEFASALGVVTSPKHQRKGFGKAVVSAATQEILRRGKIPIYDCDQDNVASVNLARSLSYRFYAEDFGCIQRTPGG